LSRPDPESPDRAPASRARKRKLLALMGVAELIDHYDIALLSMLIVQIKVDLGIPENRLGVISAWIRLGVLLSIGLGVLADRLGRRRILLVTILGYSLTTFATAFAQTSAQFVLCQLLGRGFLYAETALAVVVVAEELGAKERGRGIGVLGALGAMGYGLASIGLGAVDDLPYGWRALYAIGALPLLGLAWMRRTLPETARFERSAAARESRWAPVIALVRAYPRRLVALVSVAFCLDFAATAASSFMVMTLQEANGYRVEDVRNLYLIGGLLGVAGNPVAGIVGDRVGRRGLAVGLLAFMGIAFAGFYELDGWWIPPLWIAQVFALQGTTVLMRAFGAELFPTSYRSTASTMRMVAATAGGIAGLALESLLYDVLGSHQAAIVALLPALVPAAAIIWFAFPETAGRELEEVSPERATS